MKKTMLRISLLLIAITPVIVSAQADSKQETSGDEKNARTRISDAIKEGNYEAASKIANEYQAKYKPPAQPSANAGDLQGSVFWEEIKACGFYAQETRLECVIEIKQPVGYAGPIGSPGSEEHVKFCVDTFPFPPGIFDDFEAVGEGMVQVHDESAGAKPPWHYAVYRDFNPFDGLRTTNTGVHTATDTNGPTRNARAILSWFFVPSGCNYRPIWGNVVDFKIRFDPVR